MKERPSRRRLRALEEGMGTRSEQARAAVAEKRAEAEEKVKAVNAKAGRNLPAAIAVGIILGGLATVTLIYFHWGFIALVGLLVLLGLAEINQSFFSAGRRLAILPVSVGGVGILISAYQVGLEAMLAATFLTVGAGIVWTLLAEHNGESTLRDITATVLAVMYVPFLAGFVLLLLAECGPLATALFILITISSDTGGYLAGLTLGKHPMAPSISPKKSWEGFGGSLALATAVGLGGVYLLQLPWFVGVILGILGAIGATVGDLAESLLKRDMGVKDMGNLLPGHGGVMDRVDSLLMVAPIAYLVLRYAMHV